MKTNEKELINSIVNFEANVMNVQNYIKENYNIDSEFNLEKSEIHLTCNNINESLMLCAAKEYINEQFGEDKLHVVMG